ncbi:MAG TPA: hypothetical protein VFN48_11935 [Solirubrobacteraceae bacterium]|nr:hypothetical protein [Solirubrobacteraceae bacterium]
MSKLLHYASMLCCAFVIGSFFLFAVSQTSHASQSQASAVANGTVSGVPSAPAPPLAREHQPRRFIDQVARKLESPFLNIVSTRSAWVTRLVPTAVALLIYGFGLSYLARWAAGRPA